MAQRSFDLRWPKISALTYFSVNLFISGMSFDSASPAIVFAFLTTRSISFLAANIALVKNLKTQCKSDPVINFRRD